MLRLTYEQQTAAGRKRWQQMHGWDVRELRAVAA